MINSKHQFGWFYNQVVWNIQKLGKSNLNQSFPENRKSEVSLAWVRIIIEYNNNNSYNSNNEYIIYFIYYI